MDYKIFEIVPLNAFFPCIIVLAMSTPCSDDGAACMTSGCSIT